MPLPIPTVFRCLACGMIWVRPKSWQRTRFGRFKEALALDSARCKIDDDHCSLGLTEFCNGTIVATQDPALVAAVLATHCIGGDLAVTEFAEGNMGQCQRLRVEIASIR